MPWFRGNTHTHTNVSDGDAPLVEVAGWYESEGYNFLAITDHFRAFDPARGQRLQTRDFILIAGQEISDPAGGNHFHMNVFGITRTLEAAGSGDSEADRIQQTVERVLAEGGIPCLNHPNFGYAVSYRDMLATEGYCLFEVYNAHPEVYNQGDPAHLPVEQKWDLCLTAGKRLFGLACDDMHHLRSTETWAASPGRGWVMVRADELTEPAILQALTRGDFYASSGVTLEEVAPGETEYEVAVGGGRECRIRYIGAHGRILGETLGTRGCYRYAGDEGYVRCKVIRPDGKVAWTQPRFLDGRTP